MNRYEDILGIWIDEAEGAKFWLSVCNGLNNRNVKNIWNDKYSNVIDSCYINWDKLSTFFAFNEQIRKMIYTTNILEWINRQIRKFTKTRTILPTDDPLRKSLYLATEVIMQKLTSPISNLVLIISQFMIISWDRLNKNEII